MYFFYFLADNKWYQLDTKGAMDFPGCLQVRIVKSTRKNAVYTANLVSRSFCIEDK